MIVFRLFNDAVSTRERDEKMSTCCEAERKMRGVMSQYFSIPPQHLSESGVGSGKAAYNSL